MNNRVRFHLDENVDPDVGKALRREGIDVTITMEIKLSGQSDTEQLRFACDRGRVIVTHDTDFLKLASQTNQHWGIAFCKKGTRSVGEIIRSLILIYEVLNSEEMKGQIEYL